MDYPAIKLLRTTIAGALQDGRITQEERAEIVRLVLRVMPKAEREQLSGRLVEPAIEIADEATNNSQQVFENGQVPRCKQWTLQAAASSTPFATLRWQSIRLAYALGAFPPELVAMPVDGSHPAMRLSELEFVTHRPVSVQTTVDEVCDPQKSTLGARTPPSRRQTEVLRELGWPLPTSCLIHYRYADWLIKWWAKEQGHGDQFGYTDPSSPWSFNRDAASDAQLKYLKALSVPVPSGLTKADASQLIDAALSSNSSVSNRQMMVLRFWNQVAVAEGGRQAVTEWLEAWYDEDEDRRAAWELWKEENGDSGRQDDPTRVPIGAGNDYLRRVKAGPSIPKPSAQTPPVLSTGVRGFATNVSSRGIRQTIGVPTTGVSFVATPKRKRTVVGTIGLVFGILCFAFVAFTMAIIIIAHFL